jgi:hypothetical protein
MRILTLTSLIQPRKVDNLDVPPHSPPGIRQETWNMSKVGNKSPPWQDIAVIGLACRFPGTASDEAKFWDLLAERRCQYLSKIRG